MSASRRHLAAALVFCGLAISGCHHRRVVHSVAAVPKARPDASQTGTASPPPSAGEPQASSSGPQALTATTEEGIASWYGYPYHGRAAADGEIYDMEQFTAAHRTLPFHTMVRVTNLSNEKTVDVRITDRGPFIDGRIIDLSKAAARSIDMIGPGTARVRVDILSAPSPAAAVYAVQVGAFQDRARAERIRGEMEDQFGRTRIIARLGKPVLWRVLTGAEPDENRAEAIAARIRASGSPAFVVRLDGPSETSAASGRDANP